MTTDNEVRKATIRWGDCWLSPDGEYYDGDAHENRAVEILRVLYNKDADDIPCMDAGSLLEKLGWVRLTTTLMWEVRMNKDYWENRELTQAQINALYDWCNLHGKKFPIKCNGE